ncbi:MAG: hypothetical protein NUW22_12900 [Acidobacteria bacterium]|nr:hypothetical protein [Acidobacteriota bacterium]
MKQRLAILGMLIALGGVAPYATPITGARQKEVRVTRLHVDGGYGDLASLEKIVSLSDAVILGDVVSSRPSSVAPSGFPDEEGIFFSTAYSLKIQQVLRWSDQLGTAPESLEVELSGVGDVDRGSYIQRHSSERLRELQRDRVYLLFIRKHVHGRPPDARVTWGLATGDGQSIVELRAGNLAPQAATPLALDLARLTPTALFEKIRQIPRGESR